MGYLKDFEKYGIPFHPYIKNDQAWKVSVPILEIFFYCKIKDISLHI